MLLGEPSRTPYDLNFSIAGIPVRVHPLFWLIALILGAGGADTGPQLLLTWVSVVFVSILIHELGHALTMRYYGWQPSITLYGMGGFASYESRFTSSPSSYSRRGNTMLAQIAISAAGPAAGFLLAGAVIVGLYATGRSVNFFFGITVGHGLPIANQNAALLIFFLLYVNIFWGLINLLPVYPLDGGRIAREILVAMNPPDGVRYSLVLSIIAAAVLAVCGLVYWQSYFIAILFGYLAYNSYVMLQGFIGPRGFGGGGRPW